MRSPTLKELPPPPSGKSGWPWTVASKRMPDATRHGLSWPRISIVTPSFNQGEYIEETIRSVLLQGYTDLEYIVIDGGSTDASVDIITKYAEWLKYWVSETDKGQSHAVNKGFAKASGAIFAYINSDDLYEPNALEIIARHFVKNGRPHLMAGECVVFCDNMVRRVFEPTWPENLSYFLQKTYSSTFAQPASFWTKEIHRKVGGLDESLNYCFDREFFLRIGLTGVSPLLIGERIARFREHADSKSVGQGVRFHKEAIRVLKKHAFDCGLSEEAQRGIVKKTNNEMRYGEVFIKWKTKGRFAALVDFCWMIMRCPSLIFERKIIGQGRRLITFRAQDVLELR